MTPDFQRQHRRDIVDAAPVDVYVASYNSRYWWPYRLNHVDKASPIYQERSERYVLDSNIGDDDVSNMDVLDRAEELDADVVVPKDYLHDQERTTRSVRQFMDQYDDHHCQADVWVPLQPPFPQHLDDLDGFDAYVLGGLARMPGGEQRHHIELFNQAAPTKVYRHGLGVGASIAIIKAIRHNNDLLDSLDTSTPENIGMNGNLRDKNLQDVDLSVPSGTGSSTLYGAYAQAQALQITYMMTDDCTPPWEERDEGQMSLAQAAAAGGETQKSNKGGRQ